MNVWLITVGEPLPIDGDNERLLRAGMLAQALSESGHKVLWWTSAFDHVRKLQRCKFDKVVSVRPGYDIYLLHSIGYQTNISIRRVLDHIGIAIKFCLAYKKYALPDIVVVSFPTVELSLIAGLIGKRHGVPVITDVRDLWPDIFKLAIPKVLQKVSSIFLWPFYYMGRLAFRNSTGIVAMSPDMVQWALSRGKRPQRKFDRSIPFGYKDEIPDKSEQEKASQFWMKEHNLLPQKHFIACFFGYIGYQFDLKTIIDAARILQKTVPEFRLVLCGTGDRLEYYKKYAEQVSSVVFPGWVGRSTIWQLMRFSKIGMSPYIDDIGFQLSLPNKTGEYFSAGLPVLSCQSGYTQKFLKENECGMTYRSGDANMVVSKIAWVCENPEELKKMSANAFRIYSSQLNAQKVYQTFVDYLKDVSDNVSPHGINA